MHSKTEQTIKIQLIPLLLPDKNLMHFYVCITVNPETTLLSDRLLIPYPPVSDVFLA